MMDCITSPLGSTSVGGSILSFAQWLCFYPPWWYWDTGQALVCWVHGIPVCKFGITVAWLIIELWDMDEYLLWRYITWSKYTHTYTYTYIYICWNRGCHKMWNPQVPWFFLCFSPARNSIDVRRIRSFWPLGPGSVFPADLHLSGISQPCLMKGNTHVIHMMIHEDPWDRRLFSNVWPRILWIQRRAADIWPI